MPELKILKFHIYIIEQIFDARFFIDTKTVYVHHYCSKNT